MTLILRLLITFLTLIVLVQPTIAQTSHSSALPATNKYFIDKLLPIIHTVNQRIAEQRARLMRAYMHFKQYGLINVVEQTWLADLAREYAVTPNFTNAATWYTLLKRVDILPTSLVLAQAINESAWGRSRFAKQANNYFGQWCYQPGCGIVPAQRPLGKTYEVRVFNDPSSSVKYYYRNLNTNRAYQALRDKRFEIRQRTGDLDSVQLAAGLINYSQRRDAYIDSIQQLITHFNLQQYDQSYYQLFASFSEMPFVL